jgi:hypothetical protein
MNRVKGRKVRENEKKKKDNVVKDCAVGVCNFSLVSHKYICYIVLHL